MRNLVIIPYLLSIEKKFYREKVLFKFKKTKKQTNKQTNKKQVQSNNRLQVLTLTLSRKTK